MNNRKKILVVGSFFMDLVFRVDRRPGPGETLIGLEFGMFTGGKGYNQAIAAARMGADVSMIGCLGVDYYGDLFIESLKKEGVNIDHVIRNSKIGTGVATPVIYESEKNNSIIIIPRANDHITPQDIDALTPTIASADLLMLQLEIPIETSYRAAEIAKKNNVPVMLNPAPYKALPDDFYRLVDVITPNEVEASQISGMSITDTQTTRLAAQIILSLGPKQVVLTLGQQGAFFLSQKEEFFVPAFNVNVIDPTAAGDAFCSGYAFAYLTGLNPHEAVRMGNSAGALATTVLGAEPSLPRVEEVLRILASSKSN
ncbi:MAG: ribokinase [Anaerolineaceae bacterium]